MLTNKNPSYEHEPDHVGTVSHGTMRYVDLIPTFWDYVLEHIPGATISVGEADFYYNTIREIDSDFDLSDADIVNAAHLLERLDEILNDLADEGYYFGAHPGDGSDYGFWEVEE